MELYAESGLSYEQIRDMFFLSSTGMAKIKKIGDSRITADKGMAARYLRVNGAIIPRRLLSYAMIHRADIANGSPDASDSDIMYARERFLNGHKQGMRNGKN